MEKKKKKKKKKKTGASALMTTKRRDKEDKIERESNVKIAMSSLNHGPLHELDEGVSFLLFD